MLDKKIDAKKVRELAQKKRDTSRPQYQKPEIRKPIDDSAIRPQVLVQPKQNLIFALIVFFITLAVYALTQARTLSFWDSGEFATCASILGVPHPPGNPFYILFGRAFVTLLGGIFSHAILAAFISVLTSALAVMFTYLITVQLVSMLKVKPWEAIFAGLMSAFLTAFSFTFWMNAIEAEVYSGLVFFINLIIWLTLRWVQNSRDMNRQNVLLLVVYLFFLGFCVHQTALQIAPAILFIVVYPLFHFNTSKTSFWPKVISYTAAIIASYFVFGAIGSKMQIDDFDKWGFALMFVIMLFIELRDELSPRFWALAFGLMVVGISSHIFLAIRAADRPFINEGQPGNMQMFMDYVLRKQYGETSFIVRRGSFFSDQLSYHFLRYMGEQWWNVEKLSKWLSAPGALFKAIGSLIVGVLGLFGAVFQARRNKHSFAYMMALILCTTIIMVFVINLSNQEVRDRDYFFVVGYNMWAIWMGIGAMGLVWMLRQRAAKIALVVLFSALPVLNLVTQYHVHDRSREFIALDYGLNFLNSLEENAIIFTNGDNDTFPIWYAQAVYDPYAHENIYPARDVYPDAKSEAAIKEAMDFKNKTLKGIRKDVTVANLSLLNTGWYVRQLRDREGVIFDWPDEQIDGLKDLYVPDTLIVSAGNANPKMTFKVPYEENPQWRPRERSYRISDLAVMKIIQDNFGKRPIYFAVTCESMIGFDDYVRAEGMVNRVVHTKAQDEEQVDITRLMNNIDKVYNYRSIFDDRVYKDENMDRLIMNYAAAYAKAGSYYALNKEFDKAWECRDKARRFKVDDLRMIDFYVRYYANKGDWHSLEDFVAKHVFTHSDGAAIFLRYVAEYIAKYDKQQTLCFFEKALRRYPDDDLIAKFALYFAIDHDMGQPIKELFRRVEPTLSYPLSDFFAYLDSLIAQ